MMLNRIQQIHAALNKLNPTFIEVIDNSHLHHGHEGAKTGKGHFALTIMSNIFENKTSIQRHRLIYEALSNLMETDIHAIEIKIL